MAGRAIIGNMEIETPAGYLRVEEAARVANVSEKTVRNWAIAKRIGRRKVKGVVLYNRADLEEQATKLAETKIVRDNPYAGAVIPQLAEAVASALRSQPQQLALPEPALLPTAAGDVPLDRKLWLTMPEAIAYTGLGQFYIEQHVQGQPIGPRRAVVFRRSDLEKL